MDRRRWPELKVLTIIILSLQLSIRKGECQLSNPLAHDDGMQEAIQSNKFLSRQATDDMQGYPNLDEEALANSQCPQRVELRWQAEVSSSIYATPLIADVNADGKLDIVVPSFVHYLEVLEGADGEKLPGWPAFHQSIVHASPLLYDIDKDGAREILLATYNGEILVFRSSGYLMPDKLVVPRLRVRKDWYVGLTPDHMDRSHPDVHDEGLTSLNNTTVHSDERASDNGHIGGDKNVSNTKLADEAAVENKNLTHGSLITPSPIIKNESQKNDMSQLRIDETVPFDVSGANLGMAVLDLNRTDGTHLPANQTVVRRLLQSTGNDDSVNERESKDVKEHGSTSDNLAGTGAENQQESLDEAADASYNLLRDQDGDSLTDEYAYDYDDYVDETMWGDEEWHESRHEKEEDFVNVDSHILCTPVIADIDKDGVDELVVAASYFYDREYYEKPEHAQELGKLDIGKYVAGSVTVFNLQTRQVKWSIHLDLSTDAVNFRAYIYSSPTVVDLDGDGYLDIIVGTSFGFVYALHHNGTVRVNFPLQMGEIQGQIVAADINDDGKVEIVTADTRGNVAAWDPNGKEIWEVHLKSLIAQGPTVGDVDGDGKTDVVVPTVSGNIYVLKGVDGTFVRHFPFRTHGRVMSPVLLVNLGRGSSPQTGLTLVTTSFDGYMYLIDGPTGCADAIDIGETSYSMVVADNVDGGDDLDLIVTTMNGNVYCFQTPASHHPLKAWPMQTQGRNVISARYQREGIYVVPSSRNFRDESGDGFWVVFKIVDQMSTLSGLEAPYNVTITLLVPGNYQSDRRIVRNLFYAQPGVYKIRLPCAPVRTAATVLLEMVDKHGFYYFDEFSLTFYMQYHRLLKWMVSLPLLGMFAALVLFQTQDAAPLPSFSTDKRHS